VPKVDYLDLVSDRQTRPVLEVEQHCNKTDSSYTEAVHRHLVARMRQEPHCLLVRLVGSFAGFH